MASSPFSYDRIHRSPNYCLTILIILLRNLPQNIGKCFHCSWCKKLTEMERSEDAAAVFNVVSRMIGKEYSTLGVALEMKLVYISRLLNCFDIKVMNTCRPKKFVVKVKPSREFDVCYDDTLTFPTSKDYAREMANAIDVSTTYGIQPIFNTMFSDTRVRQTLIPKPFEVPHIPVDRFIMPQSTETAMETDVLGSRRLLYLKQPLPKPKPPPKETETPVESTLENVLKDYRTPRGNSCSISKTTQTDYRDSEAQTEPWAHDVLAMHGARLLELNWLQVDKSTPIGVEDIELIKRSWQRQAWDAILPTLRVVHPEQLATITAGLIENEIAYSERSIDEINKRRMELSQSSLSKDLAVGRRGLCGRLQRLTSNFQENSAEKLNYMKHQLVRCLRKLDMSHRKIPRKYKSRGILEELSDKASELYAPQLRFGENPARRNETIHWQFVQPTSGLEILEKRAAQSVKPLPAFKRNLNTVKLTGTCNRAIKLSEKGLEDLYMDLKAIWVDNKEKEEPSHKTFLKSRGTDQPGTPTIEEQPETLQDDLNCLLLKNVIQGRAIQTQTMRHLPMCRRTKEDDFF